MTFEDHIKEEASKFERREYDLVEALRLQYVLFYDNRYDHIILFPEYRRDNEILSFSLNDVLEYLITREDYGGEEPAHEYFSTFDFRTDDEGHDLLPHSIHVIKTMHYLYSDFGNDDVDYEEFGFTEEEWENAEKALPWVAVDLYKEMYVIPINFDEYCSEGAKPIFGINKLSESEMSLKYIRGYN